MSKIKMGNVSIFEENTSFKKGIKPNGSFYLETVLKMNIPLP